VGALASNLLVLLVMLFGLAVMFQAHDSPWVKKLLGLGLLVVVLLLLLPGLLAGASASLSGWLNSLLASVTLPSLPGLPSLPPGEFLLGYLAFVVGALAIYGTGRFIERAR